MRIVFSAYKNVPIFLLIITLLFGFFFRVSGTRFGLPDLMHPDEARIILDTMSMGQRMSLLPEDINYPLFHKYFLLVSYGLYFLIGSLVGHFKDKVDFAVNFLLDPSSVIWLSRLTTTIIGTFTILLAYSWGVIIEKSKRVGLIGALFVALEWQLVFESQYAVHQTLAGMSSLLAYIGMSLICVNRSRRSYVIGGLTMGFAVASHQTAILLFPGVLFLIVSDLTRKELSIKSVMRNWIVYAFCSICVGVIGNLNWVFLFRESLNFFTQGSGAGKVAFSAAPFFSYNVPSIVLWYFSELVRRDYFIGVMVVLSMINALMRRGRIEMLYLIVSLTYFIFFHNWAFRWMHLFVGLLPVSLLYAARMYSNILKRFNVNVLWIIVFSAFTVMPNVIHILKVNRLKQVPETRQIAREWVLNNIPENTTIAVDYPAYSVSLPSLYPTMLRNRVAKEYFNYHLPIDVRSKFLASNSREKLYQVVDMIDSKSEPVWPGDMPEEAVRRGEKSATMRDLYSYFNFTPIKDLIHKGVKYIIIESYTYGMPLVSDDSRKTPLMNYYLIDDVVPFAYHTGGIYMGSQHELMFYVVERARKYFLPLLDNNIEGVRLIKEFYPENNIGPIIKIYAVN